jgi:hypothetical protein
MPDFVDPLLVHDFKRSAIFAEVMTKNLWQRLLDKTQKEKKAASKVKPLTDRCLLRTYETHFSTAKEYYELSLRSAEENYKFQYTYRMIEQALSELEHILRDWIGEIFREQEKLTLRNRPLIDHEEREQIQHYLTWLMEK